MADVFLSYARGDRAVAERLADAIEATGLTVWWDRHIKGGAEFSQDIETQLDAATRVLVLWSKDAVTSRWVRDEASVAADSKRLVGATIDGTPPPLGFRQFQTIDLKGWSARGAAIPTALAEALEVEPTPARALSQTSSAKPAETRRWWLGFAGAVGLVLAALAWFRPGPLADWFSAAARQETVAVAIMPFAAPPGADTAWLGNGLSGSLSNSLASLSGLRLMSATSTQAVAGQRLTATEIGDRLKVSHIVEGEVQRSGDALSIIVRLVEAGSSSQLWTRSYEGPVGQIASLQASMAADLAAALQARLGVAQGNLSSNRDVDPRAFEAYLRGVELMSRRADESKRREAVQQFRLAASIAPRFADAHAALGYLLALSVPRQLAMDWPTLQAEQGRAATQALRIDPSNLLAEAGRLAALHNYQGEVDAVLKGSEALLARAPNFAPANYVYASSLHFAGRHAEAIRHYDHVVESDPFNQTVRLARMGSLIDLGNYDALRNDALTCTNACDGLMGAWFEGMLSLATPEQYGEDYSRLIEKTPNLPPDLKLLSRQAADSIILGRPFTGQIPNDNPDFLLVALQARLGSIDRAYVQAAEAIDRFQPDQILLLLNGQRLNFTPEQRADPRYHALFRHPKLVRVERYRRAKGKLAGLPVFPVRALPAS